VDRTEREGERVDRNGRQSRMSKLFEDEDQRKQATMLMAAIVLHGYISHPSSSPTTHAEIYIGDAFRIAQNFIRHAETL
jgi:hypothetical protein